MFITEPLFEDRPTSRRVFILLRIYSQQKIKKTPIGINSQNILFSLNQILIHKSSEKKFFPKEIETVFNVIENIYKKEGLWWTDDKIAKRVYERNII
jgi:hypothetical protein